MAVLFIAVYLLMAVTVAASLVRRLRLNAKLDAALGSAGVPHPERPQRGKVRLAEDDLIPVARISIQIGAVIAVLAVLGIAALVAGLSVLAWLCLAFSIAAFATLAVTVFGAKPGLRIYETGVELGYVAHAEKHSGSSLSGRMGVPHPDLWLPAPDIVEFAVLKGVADISQVQSNMASFAPKRTVDGRTVQLKVLGDFYSKGMTDALYLRVKPDRIPEVPRQVIAAGPGRAHGMAEAYWSGPELLIGIRQPDRVRAALLDILPTTVRDRT